MNRRIAIACALAALLTAAACGSEDEGEASESTALAAPTETPTDSSVATTTAGTSATTEPASSAEMRVVQDFFGDVEVPVAPERVILMDNTVLGNALALGLPTDRIAGVAYEGNTDGNEYLVEEFGELDQLPDIGGGIYSSINVEAISAAEPDLILMLGLPDDDVSRDAKATLSATGIPTFAAFNGYNSLDDSMRLLTDVGVALNMEERAAELEAEFRQDVDDTIASLPEVRPSMNAVRVFAPNDTWAQAHWLMDDIGLPRVAPAPPALFLDLSDENLDLIDADILFVSGDAGTDASLAAVESNPLWAGLTAVQNDNVHVVEDQPWGTDYSYPALVIILDHIASALEDYAAKVDA